MLNLFYLIIGIGFVFSLLVQGWLKTTYGRWSKVRNSLNLPGGHVARTLLDDNQLQNVAVTMQTGLFQLLSLPIEFDASRRAKFQLQQIIRLNIEVTALIGVTETLLSRWGECFWPTFNARD